MIVVGAIVVVALVVWRSLRARRTKTLQGRFGSEYGRTVEGAESRREAEAELAARAERRDSFDIKPLPAGACERYATEWASDAALSVPLRRAPR